MTPTSLKEMSARVVKTYYISYTPADLPRTLIEYLSSANCCVNPNCQGNQLFNERITNDSDKERRESETQMIQQKNMSRCRDLAKCFSVPHQHSLLLDSRPNCMLLSLFHRSILWQSSWKCEIHRLLWKISSAIHAGELNSSLPIYANFNPQKYFHFSIYVVRGKL